MLTAYWGKEGVRGNRVVDRDSDRVWQRRKLKRKKALIRCAFQHRIKLNRRSSEFIFTQRELNEVSEEERERENQHNRRIVYTICTIRIQADTPNAHHLNHSIDRCCCCFQTFLLIDSGKLSIGNYNGRLRCNLRRCSRWRAYTTTKHTKTRADHYPRHWKYDGVRNLHERNFLKRFCFRCCHWSLNGAHRNLHWL